jgi:hypothetical protein
MRPITARRPGTALSRGRALSSHGARHRPHSGEDRRPRRCCQRRGNPAATVTALGRKGDGVDGEERWTGGVRASSTAAASQRTASALGWVLRRSCSEERRGEAAADTEENTAARRPLPEENGGGSALLRRRGRRAAAGDLRGEETGECGVGAGEENGGDRGDLPGGGEGDGGVWTGSRRGFIPANRLRTTTPRPANEDGPTQQLTGGPPLHNVFDFQIFPKSVGTVLVIVTSFKYL